MRIILVIFAISLTSCSETSFVINSAKRLVDLNKKSTYKIGKPYQINGLWYYPEVNYSYDEIGVASWYGPNFHGKKTANGEIYNQNELTAAHKTLPMPTIVEVTNLANNLKLKVRINDRGPFVRGRIIDLSKRAAQELDVIRNGIAKVRVRVIENESRRIAKDYKNFEDSYSAESAKAEKIESKRIVDDLQEKNFKSNNKKLIIQVAAFSKIENAKNLLLKLKNFSVFIDKQYIKNNFFYRVRIGPFEDMKNAKKKLVELLDMGFSTSRIIPNYE